MLQQTAKKRVLFVRSLKKVFLGLFAVFIVLTILLAVNPGKTAAATNGTINFQARLMTSAGAITPDGTYNVEFNLYTVSSGGTTAWTEDYLNNASQGVTVKNGYVTVNLGSLTAFPTTINWDQNLWLGMTVRGTGSCVFSACTPTDSEMTPRLPLTAVPYAFKAGQLAQYSATSGFTSTLSLGLPTVGNQNFVIPDQGAAGTYNLLTGGSTGTGVQLQASTPGTAQTGNFNISGTGIAGTFNATTALQTGGTPRIDSSGNLTNIGNISGSGTLQLTGTSGSSYIMSSLGLGTISPQTGSALTVANATWLSSVDSTGSSYINMFQVNTNNQIQAGAAINVDGGIVLPTDGGQMTFSDLPVDSTPTSGTKESYTFRVGSTNALTIYGESDGAGGIQNIRTAIGSSIAPSYPLDVTGDINSSTGLRVGGTTVCTVTGCTAAGGSGSYVQLQATTPGTAQGSSSTGNFNIGGTGIANVFQAPTFDAVSGALGIGTSNATAVNIQPAGTTTATITIGAATLATGNITLGSSTGAQSILIANGTGAPTVSIANASVSGVTLSIAGAANTSTNTISIANGATAATTTVSILSGVGTAGAATLSLGNNTRVTGISLGNINPAAARTISIGNTTGTANAVVDTINVATNPTTVAGGNTVHIADGTPTGSGTNLVTIGSIAALGNQTLIQGGNGASAVGVQAATSGTISVGTTSANTIAIGNTTAGTIINQRVGTSYSLDGLAASTYTLGASTTTGSITIGGTAQSTGAITLGSSTAASSILIGNGTGASTVSIANNVATATGNTVNIAGGATATGLTDTVNIATGNTVGTGAKAVHIADGTPAGTNAVTIGSIANASTLLLQGGTGTGASAGLKLNTATAGDILIGNTGQTGAIVLGQSTATNTVQIANGSGATTLSLANATVSGVTLSIAGGANTSTNSISIANGATAATTTVSILSGVGTAGAATLSLGNNTRVTQIDLGNIAAAAARTINVGTGSNIVGIDTINVGTGATTVAGGKTIHIGDGTPTGSGTNLITVGSIAALANTTTIQGGNGAGAVGVQAASSGTISIGTVNANTVAIGNTTAGTVVNERVGTSYSLDGLAASTYTLGASTTTGSITIGGTAETTGAITLGQSTQTNTINIGNAATASTKIQTIAIGTGALTGGEDLINIGGTGLSAGSAAGNVVTLQGGATALIVGNTGASLQTFTNSTTAFQVLNATGVPVFLVDTSTSLSGNFLTNGGFELGTTTPTGWAAAGSPSTFARNTTAPFHYGGQASLQLGTTATANQGATTTAFNSAPPSGTYVVSFYALFSSGTAMTSANFQTSINGGAAAACTAGVTLSTSGFQRVICPVTAGATITSLSIQQSDANARIIYIDAVQLITGSTPAPATSGAIQLRGAIDSPVVFQSLSNSTTAFQIQNTAGTSNLFVADTLNSAIKIGGSLNAVSGYSFNGTPGSTTTCTGGQFLQNGVIQGGITTGGTCVAAGTGTITGSGTIGDLAAFTASGAIGSPTGTVSLDTATILTAGGALTLQSSTSSAITLDSGTTGQVNIGTGSGATKTIQIGNTANGVAQIINIGNNGTAGSSSTINLGSSIGSSPVNINAGSGGITITEATNTANNANGYNITLQAGNETGTGTTNGGNLNLEAGTATTGVASDGNINIGVASSATIVIGATANSTTIGNELFANNTLYLQGNVTSNLTARLDIAGVFTSNQTSSEYGFQNQGDFSPNGGSLGNLYGLINIPRIVGSGYTITVADGAYSRVDETSGFTGTITQANAFQAGGPTLGGGNPITTYNGYSFSSDTNGDNVTGTSVVNNGLKITGISAGASTNAGTTINNYDVNLNMPTGSGATGTANNYGLFIQGNGGTGANATNYSVYDQSTAATYFAGNVGIGTGSTGSANALNVVGTGAITTELYTPAVDLTSSGTLNIGNLNATTIQIAANGVAHSIQIGTGAAVQSIQIGSTTSTSFVQLTAGSGNVFIGSNTTDTTQTNLQLDSESNLADTGTCSTTTNQGAMYYNTNTNEIRACINSAWQDLASTEDLALQLFGVVPNSGPTPGDLVGVNGNANSPCKVYWVDATHYGVAACNAYSGGRKVAVAAVASATFTLPVSDYGNICLNSSGVPTLSAVNATDGGSGMLNNLTATNGTTLGQPLLCLATIRASSGTANSFGAGATYGIIYDTRTFTTTTKTYATLNSTTQILGGLYHPSTTFGLIAADAATTDTNLMGVLVAGTGVASTTTQNVILAVDGPQWVKATGTAAFPAAANTNTGIMPTATAGYISTATPSTTVSNGTVLGTALAPAIATSCTTNLTAQLSNCQESQFTYIHIH